MIRKLFNTSGQVYRKMGLKDLVNLMTPAEIFAMMTDSNNFIKLPLALDGEKAAIEFREKDYKQS